jgi:hypothetical protein
MLLAFFAKMGASCPDKKILMPLKQICPAVRLISSRQNSPCLCRSPRSVETHASAVTAQPRALIRAHPGYVLKEMAESDWCCGCGGSFNLQHYEASAAIGRRQRDNIARSGCRVVTTGCPACMLQITDMLSQGGMRVQVKHTVEIYADGLKQG